MKWGLGTGDWGLGENWAAGKCFRRQGKHFPDGCGNLHLTCKSNIIEKNIGLQGGVCSPIGSVYFFIDDFEPVCYFADGRRGYSLKYMRREELLTDVLRQYERYIRMITNSKHNLYLFDKKNDET